MQLYTSVQLSFSDSGKAANIIYRLTAQFTGAEGSHKGSLIVTQTGTMLMQQLVAEVRHFHPDDDDRSIQLKHWQKTFSNLMLVTDIPFMQKPADLKPPLCAWFTSAYSFLLLEILPHAASIFAIPLWMVVAVSIVLCLEVSKYVNIIKCTKFSYYLPLRT